MTETHVLNSCQQPLPVNLGMAYSRRREGILSCLLIVKLHMRSPNETQRQPVCPPIPILQNQLSSTNGGSGKEQVLLGFGGWGRIPEDLPDCSSSSRCHQLKMTSRCHQWAFLCGLATHSAAQAFGGKACLWNGDLPCRAQLKEVSRWFKKFFHPDLQ